MGSSSECTDFNKAIGVCDGQGIMADYDCTCKPEIFKALSKCGQCMPETYAPYGGLKAFVESEFRQLLSPSLALD